MNTRTLIDLDWYIGRIEPDDDGGLLLSIIEPATDDTGGRTMTLGGRESLTRLAVALARALNRHGDPDDIIADL